MYNLREKSILRILIEKNDFVTSEQLSQLSGINQRTIRDIMHKLRQSLQFEREFYMISRPRYGYRIVFHDENNRLIYCEKEDTISSNLKDTTSNQRLILICLHLMMQVKTVKIEELEEILFLSRTQVISALNSFRKFLEPFYVYIDPVYSKGIELIGSEADIRRGIAKFILINLAELKGNEYEDELLDEVMNVYHNIKARVNIYNEKYSALYSQRVIENITINLTVANCRIAQNHLLIDLFVNEEIIDEILINKELKRLANDFHFDDNYDQLNAFCYLFLPRERKKQLIIHPLCNVSEELVLKSIKNIDEKTGFHLQENKALITSLHIFLSQILNESIIGYYCEEFKDNLDKAGLSFQLAKLFVANIDEISKIEFDQEQIYIISHYFKLALNMIHLDKLKVQIVCMKGKLEKELLLNTLLSRFSDMIEIVNSFEIVDCLLCLEPIELKNIPTIHTNIQLNAKDCYLLQNKFYELQKNKLYKQLNISISERKEIDIKNINDIEKKIHLNDFGELKDTLSWSEIIDDKIIYFLIDEKFKNNQIIVEKLNKALNYKGNKVKYIIHVYTLKDAIYLLGNYLFFNDLSFSK